jgi:signal transduction histidine kinase
MLGSTPKGEPLGRAALRVAGLDAGRHALLLEMLAALARAQEPEAVWTELGGQLKWLLDFERCDVAVINPDGQTYHLQTVFEARPGIFRVREAHISLAAGLLGVLLQRGTPDLLLELPSDHGAPLTVVDPWLEGGSLASVFTVRLHVQGQTVGGLHVGRARAGGYAATDVGIVRQVAAQLSLVVERWQWRAVQRTTVAALHQSEALNHRLLESSGDAISLLDLAGHLLLMNPSGQRAWEIDDLTPYLGASWVACWEGAVPQAAAAVAAAASGASGHFERWYRTRRSATLTWWDVLVTPIQDRRGQPERLLAIARDITERKAAARALQRAHDRLEQRVQERTAALHREMAERQRLEREAQRAQHFALLGQLAAGMSHEIRNPLGAVFLHVDVLAEELQDPSPDSPAAVTDALAEIKTHLARIDNLVQDYLTLVRVGAIERTLQDVGTALQAWVEEWQALAAAGGIIFQWDGLATLGESRCHPSTFRRALLNLVQNAGEAMPAGGTLTLTSQETATHVQLALRDTGSGIPAVQLARIFEPLYTTKPGGTGLGLYIVHEIVAAHEGQVTVENVVDQGTTVTVTLPRRTTAASPRAP